MDSIQASILSVKLPLLNSWNEQRRIVAQKYEDKLNKLPDLTIPSEKTYSRSNYHLYVIHHSRRDALKAYLFENNIETGLHYPVPLHLQKAYRHLGYRLGNFPISEGLSKKLLSLPMHPFVSDDDIERITVVIDNFSKNKDSIQE
jgi:dTDP-4-amino-4,6-dideoxygalactose transaminase